MRSGIGFKEDLQVLGMWASDAESEERGVRDLSNRCG